MKVVNLREEILQEMQKIMKLKSEESKDLIMESEEILLAQKNITQEDF